METIRTSYFFDLDTIIVSNSRVWIVDKTIPNIPVVKISQSDFNLIKSGIYKSQGNLLSFGDNDYWIPTELYEKLKIKSKVKRCDLSNLSFSMQEFLNKELVGELEYTINMDNILHLKNIDADIYIICSKNSKRTYELIISKIEDKLKENGLVIKKFYFISETFYNRNSDEISYKKVRLLLQHLIGLKTEGDKFTEVELEKYNNVYYYDDDEQSIKLANNVNKTLMMLLSNTKSNIKDIIKEKLKSEEHILITNLTTGNKINKFIVNKVVLKFSNLIKAFDSFKYNPKKR